MIWVLIWFVLAVFGCGAAANSENTVVLDLRSACRTAADINPHILSAREAVVLASFGLQGAQSALQPRLDVASIYTRISKDTSFAGTPILEKDTLYNRVELRKIIYSGGRIESGISQALQGQQVAEHVAAGVRAEVYTSVSRAYFRARQARDAVTAADASIRALEASLEDAKRLLEAGVVTRSDVLRADVALAAARERAIAARNSYAKALVGLRTAVGLPPDVSVQLADTSDESVLDSLSAMQPQTPPAVFAAEAQVRAARAAQEAAEAERRPTLALTADFQNEPAGSEFPRRSNSFSAGLTAAFNVFDGGLTRSRIEQAKAETARATHQLESARLSAAAALEAAKLDLESAKARLQTTDVQVASAEETLRVLTVGYQEGVTPLTDVLAAESALSAARTARLTALYDLRIAQVELIAALGRAEALAGE